MNDSEILNDILCKLELRLHKCVENNCVENKCKNFLLYDNAHLREINFTYDSRIRTDNWMIRCENNYCESEFDTCCAYHIHKHFFHTIDDVWLCKECYEYTISDPDIPLEIIITKSSRIWGIPPTYNRESYKLQGLCNGESCICTDNINSSAYLKRYNIKRLTQ